MNQDQLLIIRHQIANHHVLDYVIRVLVNAYLHVVVVAVAPGAEERVHMVVPGVAPGVLAAVTPVHLAVAELVLSIAVAYVLELRLNQNRG